MEVLISVVAATMGEAGRFCFGSLCSMIQNTHQFRPDDWESCIRDLLDLRNGIKCQVESADQDGRSPAHNVKKWLVKVNRFELKASKIRARMERRNRRLYSCGFGCGLVVKLQAARLLIKAETLLEEGSFPNGLMTKNYLTKAVEHLPGLLIKDGTTASETLTALLEKLVDHKIKRIGVWGLGGVGKTTLVKNLNNKLNTTSSNQIFSVVIWITVSKELDLKIVQMKIAERLDLEVRLEESVERTAGRLYQRLSVEKFLLILDDLWQGIDLVELGIPLPEIHGGAKILLTSRSLDVCRQMMTDDVIKVNILNDDEAWDLFSQKAGWVVFSQQINPFAKAVARECAGLPLALISMGAAMRGKSTVWLWKHALKELQRSVPSINGSRDKVYNSLKWSYDILSDQNTKSCFLYCALYPEDFSIEISELVQCWLAEGLIDEQQSLEESFNTVVAVVQNLKDSCLLEEGDHECSVKMHDVVRDVAIWITSVEGECKSLCRSGTGLREIAVAGLQGSLKRISFAYNEILKLPDCGMLCSGVSTLLLQDNSSLEEVHENFFQGFQALRVLNMSGTSVRSLPPPVQVSNLRTLLLSDCFYLVELSAVGLHRKLEVLDLRATRIVELPIGMQNLVSLRQVNLSRTHYLKRIPAGVISKWTCLEVLDMTLSGYQWCFKEEGQTSFVELIGLKRLDALSIRLKSLPNQYSASYILWTSRLRKFQCFIGDATSSLPTIHDQRRVIISMFDVSAEWISWFMINSTSLVLNSCGRLSTTLPSVDLLSDHRFLNRPRMTFDFKAGDFKGLKSLTITASTCEFSRSQSQSRASSDHDLLPYLEELRLNNLRNLNSITEIADHLGLLFSKLKLIEVVNCHQMTCLLSLGNILRTLQDLETLKVSFCDNLSILFESPCQSFRVEGRVVPNLRTLELNKLPKLWALCRSDKPWPRLEQISVFQCYSLKRLPLSAENAKTIKVIKGESKWWKKLIWDHNKTLQGVEQFCEFGTITRKQVTTPVRRFHLATSTVEPWVSTLPVKLQSIDQSD